MKNTSKYGEKNENLCLNVEVSCEANSPKRLSNILHVNMSWLPNDFDFIIIDVDGIDYWIMADVLVDYKPNLICVEFNPTIPNDIVSYINFNLLKKLTFF